MDLYEALYTTRAMRRVETDPVPAKVVRSMLDAAIRAPSGGNAQQWRFMPVDDPAVIGKLAPLYADAFATLQATIYKKARERAEASGDEQSLRVISSSQWLAENFADVPLVVMVFHRGDPTGASIYPAVWNLMLAARGHGVGTTLTTILGYFKSAEVFDLLGVPEGKGWNLAASVTCGYPKGKWGVAKRPPLHEVVYENHWGQAPSWTQDEPMWDGG